MYALLIGVWSGAELSLLPNELINAGVFFGLLLSVQPAGCQQQQPSADRSVHVTDHFLPRTSATSYRLELGYRAIVQCYR